MSASDLCHYSAVNWALRPSSKSSARHLESFASNWKSISVELKSALQVLERLRGKIDGIKIYDLLPSWGGADKANNFHPLWDETVVIFTLGLPNFPAKRAHGGGRSVLMSYLQHFCAPSNFSLLYIKWAAQNKKSQRLLWSLCTWTTGLHVEEEDRTYNT